LRLLRRLVMVREGEGAILFFSTSYFFLLLFGYYLLRPMREAFGIARGADKLPWLMTGTMLCMFLANPAFAALVSRLPRRRAIPLAYRICAGCMGLFYLLFRFLPGHGGAALGYVFYIWLSVFNLFAVSVFWAFMADGLEEETGKRLFGFIAMGGTLGAIAGAATTEALARGGWRIAPASLLLVSILCLELAVACLNLLAKRFGMGAGTSAAREPGPGLFQGLGLLARSPYLSLMGLYILLYTVSSTLLYMEQGRIVAGAFTGAAARTAAFARIDVWVNVATLFTQLFLSSRLISRLGLKVVLCLMPVLTLAGFGALWAFPAFATLALFQVLRRGLHYAVDRPAREVLYIPLGPDEKYKAKPFIDTFVYRTGDLLGTWTPALLAAAALPLGGAALAVSGAWLWGGLALGRLQAKARTKN
jgi:AAA family ATP:ADP antiporter